MNAERANGGRVLGAVLWSVFFCLPVLLFTATLCWWWLLTRVGDNYYFEAAGDVRGALIFAGVSVVVCLATVYGWMRRSFSGLLFLVAPLAAFFVVLHPAHELVSNFGKVNDSHYVTHVAFRVDVWSAHGRFPATDSEVAESLSSRISWENPGLPPNWESTYRLHGQQVPYQVKVIPNSTEFIKPLPGPRPGVVYYCVSADRQEYWMAISMLDGAPGDAKYPTRVIHRSRGSGRSEEVN